MIQSKLPTAPVAKALPFLMIALACLAGCDGPTADAANEGAADSQMAGFAEAYAQAWSSGEPAAVAGFYEKDGVLVVNAGAPAEGRDAITEVAAGFMTAFPNLVVRFDRLTEEGDRTAFHWTLTGTNTGPGGTGAGVMISGRELWRMREEGLISHSQGFFDVADYEAQLAAGSGLSAADTEAITAATEAWVAAYNRNDWVALADLFSPEATMMPPNHSAVVGRAAIAAWEEANEQGFRIAFDVEQIDGAGDVAYVRGRSCVFIPLEDGAFGVDPGKYLEVRRRTPQGQWPIEADIFNTDLGPGEDLADTCPFGASLPQ